MADHQPGGSCPLRIAVFSPVDPRWARTNAVADVRLCTALASHGHRVQWVIPSVGPRRELSREDILARHAVPYPFEVQAVRTPRRHGPREVARVVPLVATQAWWALRPNPPDYTISRDLRLLLPLLISRRRARAVPWLHEYRDERWERFACRCASRLLATNSAILEDVRVHAPDVPTFVTGNPILEERATSAALVSREAARRELRLAGDRPLVVYTGKLYPGMAEIGHLVHAAKQLPDWSFLLTGGQPAAIARLRRDLAQSGVTNIILTGFLEKPEQTRLYQKAADVLVSYYSTRDHAYAHHNLPNKLAEYMSTGNPVVVADFPAVREWATPKTAALVEPDNPAALVATLVRVQEGAHSASQMAAHARRLVEEQSFESVAGDLERFLAATGRDRQ